MKNRSKHARIRTITLSVPGLPREESIVRAANKLREARTAFIDLGYDVQSRRISLDHWDLGTNRIASNEREALFTGLHHLCSRHEIDFCSIGTARNARDIEALAEILSTPSRLSGSAQIAAPGKGIDGEAIAATARAVIRLGTTPDGFGNFRFAAGSFINPGTPFFPCAYHDGGSPSFSIGLENSGLLVEAFQAGITQEFAINRFQDRMNEYCRAVVEAADAISSQIQIPFRGLDTSIAPSLQPEESITLAFNAMKTEFGAAGTLALCGAVTSAVKSVPVPQVGYCGIMLPVLEDVGLAKANDENRFGIIDLLAYSSVCGVGLDMIPVAGEVGVDAVERLLLDLTTISNKLSKPLAARILPVKGKHAGEMTAFDSPYVCNSRVMAI